MAALVSSTQISTQLPAYSHAVNKETVKAALPYLDGEGSLQMEPVGLEFEKALRHKIPLYAVKTIRLAPKIGEGYFGEVYKAAIPDGSTIVYKIRKRYSQEVKSEAITIKSFEDALDRAIAHQNLPKSRYFTECRGIVYVEDLKLWGVSYEFIPGRPSSHFDDRATMIEVMTHLCQALKILDSHGYPNPDIRGNFIIRDGIPVLFDDLAKGSPSHDPQLSVRSRSDFGELFDVRKFNSVDVFRLHWDCTSKHSMGEFGWDQIAKTLQENVRV